MNFLAPLFLIGGAAIALPVIFHLIRRSSRDRVLFSSLMFLRASPPQISKKSKLEQVLLLLLRCLVLLLLAFAFARPFIRNATPAAPRASAARRVALLIDTSASMHREKLWDQAKAKALEHARKLKPEDQFAAFAFDRQLRPILGFNEVAGQNAADRAAALQSRLEALKPGWFSTHFGNGLIGAAEALIDAGNKDTNDLASAQIIVISDMQSGGRLEGLQGFEWPKRFEVLLDPVQGEQKENASLQILEDPNRIAALVTNVPVRIRVHNDASSKKEQFEITWASGPKPIGEKLNIYVPAGQSRTAVAPPLPPGSAADRLLLMGDQVDFDNNLFFVPPKSSKISVAFLGKDDGNNPNGSLYFIKRAFEQSGAHSIEVLSGDSVGKLRPQETALAVATDALDSDQARFVRELLAAGKTLLMGARDVAAVESLKLFVGSEISAREGDVANYAMLGQIDFTHPLFSPFADARFSDFTKIHFWKYRAIELGSGTNAVVPARFDNGSPALTEFKAANGRVLLLASTWMPSDSQLALSSKFVPLLFTILEQSAELRSEQHQFVTGENIPISPRLTGAPASVRLPDGTSSDLATDQKEFTGTTMPGIYSAQPKGATGGENPFQFAVNLDPAEGKLTPLNRDDFQTLGVPLSGATATASPELSAEKQQHLLDAELESRQRIWHTLVLAAVLFVLLESFLAARASAPKRVAA